MHHFDRIRYPWYVAIRYRFVRAVKDAWGLIDRRVRISQIDDYVYLGGKLTPARRAFLDANDISCVVSLQAEEIDAADGLQSHLWLPSFDGRPPTQSQLLMGTRYIAHAVRTGAKIYVHCHAGVGRAPTLAAAYLVTAGLPPAEALRKVRDGRAWIRLNAQQRAAVHLCAQHPNVDRPDDSGDLPGGDVP